MRRWFFGIIIIIFCLSMFTTGRTYALQNRIRVHDPSSIIKCGDTYWIFYTGGGVRTIYSTDLIRWNSGPSLFSEEDYPEWINDYVPEFGGYFWAPECYYMNGRFYLYYSCSTFGSRISCIGLATNASLDPNSPEFEWVDEGLVIQSDYTVNYNAIDPAIFRDTASNLWMTFGSWNGGIRIMQLDGSTGKCFDTMRYSVATATDAEAPYVVYRNGYYYLFFNRGNCCQGTDSTYYVQVGRSTSPNGEYVDMSGRELDRGGGTTIYQTSRNFIGPGHIGRFVEDGTEWTTFHYYNGHNEGRGTLALGYMGWDDMNDWPYISLDWIDAGRYRISNFNSGLVWQASDNDEEPVRQVTTEIWEGLDGQKWDFAPLGNGYFLIMNALGGIAANGFDNDAAGDTALSLYPFSGFHIEKTCVGDYVLSAGADNRVVEVSGASVSIGAPLELSDYTGGDHQRFELNRVDVIINNPPEVSIVSPADGYTCGSGVGIDIDVIASDDDGRVIVVEFYNGPLKLGEDSDSPYSFTWDNVTAGNYALIARAIDNDGAVTAAGINIKVGGRPGR